MFLQNNYQLLTYELDKRTPVQWQVAQVGVWCWQYCRHTSAIANHLFLGYVLGKQTTYKNEIAEWLINLSWTTTSRLLLLQLCNLACNLISLQSCLPSPANYVIAGLSTRIGQPTTYSLTILDYNVTIISVSHFSTCNDSIICKHISESLCSPIIRKRYANVSLARERLFQFTQ